MTNLTAPLSQTKKGKYTYTVWCEQNPQHLDTYLGNYQIKRHGVMQRMTPDEQLEYARCWKDPVYFAEKYCKVVHPDHGMVDFVLYPYQRNMFNHFHNHRFNIVLACRQSGKSISSVAYLLWFALFHTDKLVAVLANKGATSREMLSRITLMLENLPFFLQPGCKALNKGSIEFSNGSRIEAHATSGSSIRGKSPSLIYLDEFAFVQDAETFYTATYPVISAGKDSKVIITSTANGIGNPFYKIWEGAVQGINEYSPFRVDWWDVPGRDDAWKLQTIANTSELQFEQEFGNNFGSTSNTLIDGGTLLGMRAWSPVRQDKDRGVFMYEVPMMERQYVIAVDVAKGRGQDYSTFSVIDVTEQPYKQVCTYRNNTISPLNFPDIIYRFAKMYNDAFIIVEANDIGSLVYKTLHYDYEYANMFSGEVRGGRSMGLEMTKKTKRIGCSNLKDMVESKILQIGDMHTIEEFNTFESKGDSYAARDGCHDDMVMNLVGFAWFAGTPFFQYLSQNTLRGMMQAERDRLIEESVTYFGKIMTGKEVDDFVWAKYADDGSLEAAYKLDDVFGEAFGVTEIRLDDDDGADRFLF